MTRRELSLRCDCTPVVDLRYDIHGDTSLAEAVVDAVSVATHTDPIDLPRVYDEIDPEALDKLFDHPTESRNVVAFTFNDWNVFVRDDGRIRVCDPSGSDTPSPVFE